MHERLCQTVVGRKFLIALRAREPYMIVQPQLVTECRQLVFEVAVADDHQRPRSPPDLLTIACIATEQPEEILLGGEARASNEVVRRQRQTLAQPRIRQ